MRKPLRQSVFHIYFINEESINMNTISKKKSISASFVMFALVILAMIFLATPIQMKLGMTGVLVTEIILLAMAIIGVFVMKGSLKEVFPIKKPTIRQTFGAIFFWIGLYFVMLFSTLLIGYFFPESMNTVSTGMNDLITSVPVPVRFLIIAVSPAICEEAVHRGFILHYLKPLNKKWLIVLIMSVLFGIFHLDPMRFLSTAILGLVFTYVVVETENIFYGFLLHLLNNALSVSTTLLVDSAAIEASADASHSLLAVGSYLLIMCISPWFIWAGCSLLKPKNAEKKLAAWKKALICAAISVFCIIGGIGITTYNSLTNCTLNTTKTTTIAELESAPYVQEFDIEKDGKQQLTAVMTSEAGIINVTITDANGTVVHETSAKEFFGNLQLELPAGHYTLKAEFTNPDSEDYSGESPVVMSFMILQL